MSDFRSEYKVLSHEELETIKMRIDANPGLLQDPEIVNRMIATLEQQAAMIESLAARSMRERYLDDPRIMAESTVRAQEAAG